jgi:hypothetical protein
MKKLSLKLFTCLLGAFLITNHCFASETEEIEIIAAGSKQLCEEEHLALKQKRADDADKESERGELVNNAMYITTHPLAAHGIYKISTTLDKVILNDGSIWKIYYYSDRAIINRWTSCNDQVIITPTSIFSPTDYQLVSQRTGESVYVSLTEIEVIPGDPYFRGQRLFVHSMDYLYDSSCGCYFYAIRLSDGTLWEVDTRDNAFCSLIYPGDIVFVGVDESVLSPTHNILVHFNSLEYVHADCVAY